MCGILGTVLFGNKDRKRRSDVIRRLFFDSLINSISRGKDATGMAITFQDKYYVLKQPVNVEDFVLGQYQTQEGSGDCKLAAVKDLATLWKEKGKSFQAALGHVRAATKGSRYEPENNHPVIITGNQTIMGVHNGVISNDDELAKQYNIKRSAEVDSEIIFQMLLHFSDGTRISQEAIAKTAEVLDGSFAFLATSSKRGNEVVGAVNVRPLDVFYIPEISGAILVSEGSFVKKAVLRFNADSNCALATGTLSLIEPKTSLSMKAFTIDINKKVESADDIFSEIVPLKETKKKATSYSSYGEYGWENYKHPIYTQSSTPPPKPEAVPPPKPAELEIRNQALKALPPPKEIEVQIELEEIEKAEIASDGEDITKLGSAKTIETQNEDENAEESLDEYCENFLENRSFDELLEDGEDLLLKLVDGSIYDPILERLAVRDFNSKTGQNLIEYDSIVNEEAAAELYRGVFAEGFAIGVREGVETYSKMENEEDEPTCVESLKKEIARLEESLNFKDQTEEELLKVIANLMSQANITTTYKGMRPLFVNTRISKKNIKRLRDKLSALSVVESVSKPPTFPNVRRRIRTNPAEEKETT